MKKDNKKTKKERRILVAALLVAAVTIAGSTFAWFTSKDEVTNRLSASANYGVSIAEDFQPPENWVPGQEINKDVSAVNTGNVDAFVRMWLEGEMSLMKKLSLDDSTAIPGTISTNLGFTATVANDQMNALGFAYHDNNNKYYKLLSTTERTNPAINGTNTNTDDNNYSEVKSVQAGGYLVYAPADAEWTYTTEQQTEITNKNGQLQVVAAGQVIGSKNVASGSADAFLNVDQNCVIDADTFTPVTPGLYIFRRNVDIASANSTDTYEYSGYVFDGTNYFALCNDSAGKSDYTLPNGAVTVATTTPQGEPLTYTFDNNKIKLYTASETVVENSGLTWTYDNTANAEKLTARYVGADTTSGTADDIVIDVALADIGTTGQTWTAMSENSKTTFYYNDDLEAGDSTAKLIDSVKLSDATTQDAFIAFDFDLNVLLESVQVTTDASGNETTTPVESGGQFAAATNNNVVTAYADSQSASEIEDIVWH